LETVLYCSDLDAAEKFYGGILGLTLGARSGNRGLHYIVGEQVLLIFNPIETVKGGVLPPHGAQGAGHFALQIESDQYGPWQECLRSSGIEIELEHDWPNWNSRSIYFRDPAGNLAELITRGAWNITT
jgi:catechol 2,3-dioxygenase-like lactoylglutathione lyase family enzyme